PSIPLWHLMELLYHFRLCILLVEPMFILILLCPVAAAQGTSESEAKSADGNERARKKSKRASGSDSKNAAAAASGSGNDVATQSAESGSEGSSDGSEDDNGKGYCVAAKKGSFDQMLADGQELKCAIAQSNGVPNNYRGAAGVAVPATNPNIGMDIWRSSSAGSGASKLHQTPPGVSPAVCEYRIKSIFFFLDEREMKRQKRKQSNRESARRSRLRKQAECERLQQKVETLTNENRALRDELQRVTEECDKLEAENDTIKEELSGFCGPEMLLSKLGRSSSPSMTGE
ncbi:hypothetical protein M569_11766, partial [Genlisea aurea]